MTRHELKLNKEYFEDIVNETKRFEVRKNDRNYKVGDILSLKEWNLNGHFYTGREVPVIVTYILDNLDYCVEDTVIMSIKKLKGKEIREILKNIENNEYKFFNISENISEEEYIETFVISYCDLKLENIRLEVVNKLCYQRFDAEKELGK